MAREKKSSSIQIRIPSKLAKAVKTKAELEDRPLSDVIRDLLKKWVYEPHSYAQKR